MTFEELVTHQQHAAEVTLAAVSRDVFGYRSLTDDELLARYQANARLRRLCDASDAVMAGEIARRSAVTLGGAGLAQRKGYRTAVELVRVTSGLPGRDAAVAVRAGTLMQDAADAVSGGIDSDTGERLDVRPWLRAVSLALSDGTVSIAAADAICTGIGEPCDGVSVQALTAAVAVLLVAALELDTDRLGKEARFLRDQLDDAGIADRETVRREARSLKFFRQPDGMARLMWVLDPETAALIGGVYDRITSPRRGGPRFVDTADASGMSPDRGGSDATRARMIADDSRTTEQLASDVFTGLVTGGATMDTSQLLGDSGPIVRMLVLQTDLDEHSALSSASGPARTGHGYIEGEIDPVSIHTIERAICTGIIQPILFDHTGHALDIAPDRRLFSRKQRIALAVTFGGCVFPGCDRPPSWTEAHHINHVVRDHGKTITADGVLLCKHHHLLTHNNGWEITRTGAEYWLIPPPKIDRHQTPILLTKRSPAHANLTHATAPRTG